MTPRILEIGEYAMMGEAYPDSVDHWSTTRAKYFRPGERRRRVTFSALPQLASDLASANYDLVVVQPNTFAPWQWQAISRALFARETLQGSITYARYFGQQMLRGRVRAPVAVWDWDEQPFVFAQNLFLLDAATLYFKRELPPDHWRVFMGSIYDKVPTARFRTTPRRERQVRKLRPISLGLPIGHDRLAAAAPLPDQEKTADIFFAGRVRGSSTVRQQGLQELLALRDKGYRVDIPDNNLPIEDFLRRCAAAWITWSPEGYSYDCFRTYEAAICGSVPVLNRQTVERHAPLRDGEHCLYYDVEPGQLMAVVEAALADRARLSRLAQAARAHVLAAHTHAALGRYVAETTLAAARSGA
jgi:hypothetical protein